MKYFFKQTDRYQHGSGVLGILLVLILWKLASKYVGSDIILPPPETTAKALWTLLKDPSTYIAVFYTVIRGLGGFLCAIAAALITGIAAGLSRTIRSVFTPVLMVLRSTPVISIILLALIWVNSSAVPVLVAFLMIYPIVCTNIIHGMLDVDPSLLEMANVYEMKAITSIRWIYLPSVGSQLYSGLETAAGLTWKVVIAAEVLSRPDFALGTSMQESRIYLETAMVFAWTICALIISSAFHFIIMRALPLILPGADYSNSASKKRIIAL